MTNGLSDPMKYASFLVDTIAVMNMMTNTAKEITDKIKKNTQFSLERVSNSIYYSILFFLRL